MSRQPTPIRRGSLDAAYETVTRDADTQPVDESAGLLHTVATAMRNGDAKVFINLSTVLATIFGVVVLAVAGRVFLNAVALMEVKILLETSNVVQVEYRTQANRRFQTIEAEWKQEVQLMRKSLTQLQADMNAIQYRVNRTEDMYGIKSKKSK